MVVRQTFTVISKQAESGQSKALTFTVISKESKPNRQVRRQHRKNEERDAERRREKSKIHCNQQKIVGHGEAQQRSL